MALTSPIDAGFPGVLVVFGIGLGAGVALAQLLGGPVRSPPTLGRGTERLGRQMKSAIGEVLPASVSKYIVD